MKPNRPGRKLKYPWPQLKVGVMLGPFMVPTGNHLLVSANQWSKRNKEGRWKFTTEKFREGYAIKRIK